ncbi:hypothetical protein LTR53_005677 [Teratosphaeriaceae sp. CCFEE 6253]|nr:hypothetical protein LTR53_005677 [Teratosphaeriaceae sp. CCFEE 6253]
MAGITSSSRLPDPDDFDYSVSHRTVPIPTVGYSSTRAHRPAEIGDEPGQARGGSGANKAGAGAGDYTRRRGSLGDRLLHRGGSVSQSTTAAGNAPSSRIVPFPTHAVTTSDGIHPQQHHHAASASGETHARFTSTSSDRDAAEEGNHDTMLRKLSSGRHEQDRLAREAAIAQQQQLQRQQTPRQAPRLPSINDFHDEARPDSLAIFNTQYGSHAPPAATTTANFSRPGHAAMAPSSSFTNSSSSPAYAIRPGNAFAQQAASSSSPAMRGTDSEPAIDRAESMAHRGRYSYASTGATAQPAHVNSPRRVRRRKDPTPFNILVVGAKNSGKTSFIAFLRHSFALPSSKQPYPADTPADSQANGSRSTSFTSHYLETDMEGERVGLTLWDSAGLEKHIIDLQLREMATFVESKFEETFVEEQKVNRSPGVKDTHIHCVLLVLDPVKLDNTVAASGVSKAAEAEGLDDEMDLQVLRALWGKTTVIPVVSKADTLTVGHMAFLKRAVWSSLKTAKLDPLEALELDDEEEEEEFDDDTLAAEDEDEARDGVVNNLDLSSSNSDYDDDSTSSSPAPKPSKRSNAAHARHPSLATTPTTANGHHRADDTPYLPMSILSPDPYDLPPFTNPSSKSAAMIGRRFPWGLADPYEPEHCDFLRLRDSIFSEWRGDLRELARSRWYENWRTSRLKNLPGQGKARVKGLGGITPTGAVPREGRSGGGREVRGVSSGGVLSGGGAVGGSVPRSVEAMVGGGGAGDGGYTPVAEQRSLSKAERMMGISAADAQSMPGSRAGGATYRGVETYQ